MGREWTDRDIAEWNRIRRKVDSIRGQGVVNAPDSVSINAPGKQPITGAPPLEYVWAKITTSAAIAGSTNRWQYGWTEQEYTKAGRWQDKPGGLTHTTGTIGGFAFNTYEANNSATGVQGNSINVSNLAPGFTIQPVQGAPVVRLYRMINCEVVREWEWLFSYTNAVQGTCP